MSETIRISNHKNTGTLIRRISWFKLENLLPLVQSNCIIPFWVNFTAGQISRLFFPCNQVKLSECNGFKLKWIKMYPICNRIAGWRFKYAKLLFTMGHVKRNKIPLCEIQQNLANGIAYLLNEKILIDETDIDIFRVNWRITHNFTNRKNFESDIIIIVIEKWPQYLFIWKLIFFLFVSH